MYFNTAPEDEFSLRARCEEFARSIIKHIDDSEEAHNRDLITRIAFKALAIVLPDGGVLSPMSPMSPDFYEAAAPCETPDDGGFVDFLDDMKSSPDTQATAMGFVGGLAATAAVYARTVARLVDRVFTQGGATLEALKQSALRDEEIMARLREDLVAVNETGVAHG